MIEDLWFNPERNRKRLQYASNAVSNPVSHDYTPKRPPPKPAGAAAHVPQKHLDDTRRPLISNPFDDSPGQHPAYYRRGDDGPSAVPARK